VAGVSDQLYAEYRDHRRHLIDAESEAAKSYDRWLLTLSGGALGLSIAFTSDIIVAELALRWPLLLWFAWVALVVAIALGLVCIYLSQTGHKEFRRHLDQTLEKFAAKRQDGGFWAEVRRKQDRSLRARWVRCLNIVNGAAFVTGIVLLSVFACVNVPIRSSKAMAEKQDQSVKKIIHGDRGQPTTGDDPVIIPASMPPFQEGERAMEPPTAPVDQAPPQKPEKSVENG